MAWYILVVGFTYFFTNLFSFISYRPTRLFNDPATIYLITSSLIVLVVLIIALIALKSGNTLLYFIALISVCGDTLFGMVYQIVLIATSGVEFSLLFIFAFIIPLIFKSAAVRGFISNLRKYKQYALQKSAERPKINAEIVDI